MSEPPLPPPLSPLVKGEVSTNLARNRIELLQNAEALFRKHAFLIIDLQEYFNQILFLGENIHRFVDDLENPEQAIWLSKHKYMFDPIIPGIERYKMFYGVLIKIMVLDQILKPNRTPLYTHNTLMHLMILLIGEELTRRSMYSERAVEQIAQKFMYLLDLIREFFRRRNICLNVLSDSLTIDSRLLESSKYYGSFTFLLQFVAVDEMNAEHTWRAMNILAKQERHVTNLLKAQAEKEFEKAPTTEIKMQAKREAVRYFELAKHLGNFIKTLDDEISENAKVKKLEAEKEELSAKAKKNAENAAKANANRKAQEAAEELLREETMIKLVATEKAEKEKKKREEKAARKAYEKAEADRIAKEKAMDAEKEKAEFERIAAEKKAIKNSVKKSSNLLAASMQKRAPELMTTPRALLSPIKKTPAPSPTSLPPSVSPSISPLLPARPAPSVLALPSASPPNLSNAPRLPTPSLAKIGFTPYSRPSPVMRFWETLDHRYIYQILYDIFIRIDNPNARFYLKGSAAVHMYKKISKISVTNHTSDYDTTLLINPELDKSSFYTLRSYMLNIIIARLADALDDPHFNAEVITRLHSAGIPFGSFAYYNAGKREPVYTIEDKIPQEHVAVPAKSGPRFYSDTMNQFPYASYAAKPSKNVLNFRILRTLEDEKHVTVITLYTKTSPPIDLIDIAIPFYEYNESEEQISLTDQWKAADRINILDGIPVLTLPALKAEQQKMRSKKDSVEIDRRIADINILMSPKSRTRRRSRQ